MKADLDSTDQEILDNPVWQALAGSQGEFGRVSDLAALYDMSVSPFGGLKEASLEGLAELAGLCGSGRVVALMYKEGDLPTHPDWTLLEMIDVRQMVCKQVAAARSEPSSIGHSRLTPAMVAQMIGLVKLTNPGPFGKRTIELGHYLGVVEGGELRSMAGQRFKPPGWTEISGVCTHPTAQGRGLAAGLVAGLMHEISRSGQGAFLHVRIGSPSEHSAAGVYERLGFRDHQIMKIAVLQRR